NGNYLIVSETSGNVVAGSGTDVVLTQLNGGLNQQWQTYEQVNGTPAANQPAIVNSSSNLVLDEPNPSTANFIPDQFDDLGTQDWYLSRDYPGGVDIHGQPSNAVVGQPISPAIAVAVVDAKGNTMTTNNSQLVTLSIASGPAGAQLLGTTTVRAVNGVADF